MLERGWIPANIPSWVFSDSDSNFAGAEQVVDPKGTWTFRIGDISIPTTLVISFLVSVPLARENAYLIGPSHSQIRLNLLTVVLIDGAGIFLSLSRTGHVALARTASLNVIAFPLEEPLKDLSTPHIGSLIGVHGNIALCFTEGIGASPEWSEMIRNIARNVWSSIPLGQKWQSPRAGPIRRVWEFANQFDMRERSGRRCERRHSSGLGRA